MDYEYILVEQRGPALWVTLNRPAALNSLSLALAEELAAATDTDFFFRVPHSMPWLSSAAVTVQTV